MRTNPTLAAGLLALAFATLASAQDDIAEILSNPAIDYSRPADRARAMMRIEAIENARLQNARAKAMAMGLALRVEKPGGGVKELIDFDGDQPVYLETKNANAAISTTANLVRTSPYTLDGTGLTVGVWDAAGGRPTHQEFATGSRLTNMNGTAMHYHSMHCAGTIAAFGVDAPSRGMANAARINSYDWNSDISEMGTAGATAAGQTATKVYLSNHSYGTADGWDGNTWTGTGTDQNAYDISFGQYSSSAQSMDSTAYNTPYFLSFWAAGNERSDNPSTGASVVIGGVTTTYNAAIHPQGDGTYRNGYETISYRSTAKNVVTVGAVNDAVTSGVRDLVKATISTFSSTGPTDDGRIKPDLVANGVSLKSSDIDTDNDYRTLSGTSMATPNACGSATLLVDQYNRLFGSAMRSSTLKALLIQTADDIGNPGPDYYFGWGLIDVKDAADLLIDHQAFPTKKRLTEDQVSTSSTSRTQSFTWDGVSPIRATLCWTDPAGTTVSIHDSRTPTLKNNLNLKLVAPNGAEHFPFIMPFVGTWTVASMNQNATTGINNTDNVEQVLVTNPGQTGSWQAVVSYSGTLTNSLQKYGLIISGSENENVPLAVTSITPASGLSGATVTADITGTKLSATTAIRLKQAGRADIIGTSVQMINSTILRCQFNLTGAASGLWNLVATNLDTETYTLPGAFTISGSLTTLWSENFDGTPTGWTSQATTGSSSWTITTAQSHSPTKSYFAPGPSSASTTYLTSPSISIPANPTNLQIEFWHTYDLQAGRDGGRFALSIDGGAWFDVADSNSGAAFISNGYNTAMFANGQTGEFAGLQAWSDVSGGFIRTAINLNDIPKFAGKSLRLRWGLATNNQSASTGWYVDSVALLSDSSPPNQPPTITVAASTDTSEFQTVGPTTYHVLRGTGTNLSVTATDDASEPDLTYTWQSIGPAPVTYSLNGNNAAKNTTATFSAIGDYLITVTALDSGSLSTVSTVNVRVLETADFVVAPDTSILNVGQNQQFTATLINQFGTLLSPQPSPINWSTTGGGSITSGGLFTATSVGGPYLITATAGANTSTAEVTVNRTQAGIELQNLNRIYNGSQQFVTAVTSPPDLAYSVTYNGQSTAPTSGGSYDVVATITDPNYEGTTSGTLIIAYSINYQGNGSTSGTAPADQTKFHDINLTLATNSGNLNKTDYSFVGWNTAVNGSGTDYPTGTIYSGNASLTLHAKWAPGADGTWVQTTAGPFDWGTPANWSGGTVASGADRTAFFTPNITAAQVVNLESTRTIGNITFTDSTTASNDLTISGANVLNLVHTSGTPTINVTNRTLTISSVIAGSNGLRKSGSGTLTLTNTSNSYSGGTVINAGTLATTADTNLGSGGGITVNGTASWNMGINVLVTYNRSLTINEGVILTVTSGNAGKTITGVLSGNGNIVNNSTTGFDFNNNGNTFTGTVNNGYQMSFSSLGDSSNPINLVGSNSTFVWNGAAKTFALRPFTIQSASTEPDILNNGSGALTIQQNLAITGAAGARTLTLGGSNAGANLFSGNVADGTGSVVSLSKSGAGGNWALSGNNTYSGLTTMVQTTPGTGNLVFQGMQALSPNTSLTETHAGGTGGHGIIKLLDDSASPASRSTVNLTHNQNNASQNIMSVFVGNNSTTNGGSSSSTQTGSTIQLGNMSFNQTATGATGGTGLTVTGTNDYKLQLAKVNVVLQAAYAGNWNVRLQGDTAPITITGNVQQLAGATSGNVTLQLDGANTGNLISGNILNSADGIPRMLSLSKAGTGTWTLSGNNSYTGTTTVSGGTLLVNGSLNATSNITVQTTGILGGTGTITGSVTVATAGNVAPGISAGTLSIDGGLDVAAMATGTTGKLKFELGANTATSDQLAVTGTVTIGTGALGFSDFSFSNLSGGPQDGTYILITSGAPISGTLAAANSGTIGVGGTGTLAISGNNIIMNVTGLGGGPGPVDHFAITAINSSQTVGTPITGITLTAQDSTNATATGFTGTVTFGGTGGFSGNSASFTAGVLSGVSVTPTVAGSNLTFTVDDGATHTGTTVITTIQTQYQTWAGGALFDADTNNDGVHNGMAWVLGAMDATANATDRLPKSIDNVGNLRMTFRCLKSTKRGGVVLKIQSSNDLSQADPWINHEASVPDANATNNGVIFTITPDGENFINVVADIPASDTRIFARLTAVEP